MRRRAFVIMAGSASLMWRVQARSQQRVPMIGLLDLGARGPTEHFLTVLRDDLRLRGVVEGRDLRLVVVDAAAGDDRLLAAARALVGQTPSVVIAFGDPATRAVQKATNSIPIVAMVDDMIGSGFIPGLARPGSNTTGLSILASELDVKRLSLLHEAVPEASRIGILADSSTVQTRARIEQAAHDLGVELVIANFASSEEAVRAADRIAGSGVGAINVLASPLVGRVRQIIIDQFNHARLLAIYQWPEYANLGGCLAYGPNLEACYRKVADIADRILRGAVPSDLPVQQPDKFEFVINLKTAKTLGLTVPQLLLAQADEVVE